jgi:hypothetical protein
MAVRVGGREPAVLAHASQRGVTGGVGDDLCSGADVLEVKTGSEVARGRLPSRRWPDRWTADGIGALGRCLVTT